jgi:hypothetical protein
MPTVADRLEEIAEAHQRQINEMVKPIIEMSQVQTQLAAEALSTSIEPLIDVQQGMKSLEAMCGVLASDIVSIVTGSQMGASVSSGGTYSTSVARSSRTRTRVGTTRSSSSSTATAVPDYTWGLSDWIESITLLGVWLWDQAIERSGLEPTQEALRDRDMLRTLICGTIANFVVRTIMRLF